MAQDHPLSALMRTHHCGQLRREDVGREVILCGWVNKSRDLGGLYFIDIRDKFGVTQLSFDDFKGDRNILKKCALESVIKAVGKVVERPAEAQNSQMNTGEVEVAVTDLELLGSCDVDSLPFLPYGKIDVTENQRLKYRYLDLRTEKLQRILKLRSDAAQKARKTLHEMDFVEVETPILYKSTPEGARDYVVPSRVHPGHVYALPQSPQTLKQLLMIGGTDRYFQLSRCFRDEDLRADRQPEFTQIDIEASFVTSDSIKYIAEQLMKNMFNLDDGFTLPAMSYAEAMRRFGSDKPDVRFGLEHLNVTSVFGETDFKVFKSVFDAKGLIKAIFVPTELGSFSRKDVDGLTDVVKPYGGKGVAFFKQEASEVTGGISKFITPEILSQLQDALKQSESEKSESGTWLFCADPNFEVTHACADALRRHLGKSLNLRKDGYHFLWVYDFPLFEDDPERGRLAAKHHPFTMPKVSEVEKFLSSDPSSEESRQVLAEMPAEAYDVVCNGYELGGGSIRIYRQDIQHKMFQVLGFTEEEAKKQFGFFLEALRYGTPPHGGIAFGLDRIIMLLAQTENIRDVIAFPKTTTASDLMSSSPSVPAQEQLEELHFSWNKKD